jgi:hypothetical protein
LNLAAIYNRLIKLSGAEVIQYWEMMGQDYQLNDGTIPFPASDILSQFAVHLPTGSTVVATSANTTEVVFFAAKTPRSFVVQLVNQGIEPASITLHGLPDGDYSVSTLTESGNTKGIALQATRGKTSIDLPPLSVVTITAVEK